MRRLLLFVALILSILTLATFQRAQAAVTLFYFAAEPDLTNKLITLSWETGSELDFAGFRIERSLEPNDGFEPLVGADNKPIFFPAKGEGGAGALYEYDDTKVNIGVPYYYRLEMIDNNSLVNYSDVVSIILGYAPTPTATATATATSTSTVTSTSGANAPTATSTSTPSTPTPTSTRTNTQRPTATITRTPSPFHAVTYTSRPRSTYTPTETATITSTPSEVPTVTTTLAPLPSLTLLFPVRTPTPTYTPSLTNTVTSIPPTPTPTLKPDDLIPLRISFLGGILILLWLTLAGFLFTYLRRMAR
jgi:hypothetical protein